MRRRWTHFDVGIFIEHLYSADQSSLPDQHHPTVDDVADQFDAIIINLLDKFAPVTEIAVRDEIGRRGTMRKVARGHARRLQRKM